jgi:ABC-type branched-subunit amino acid transport system substrate-binding protein/serine/threonine protein kinase
MLGELLAGRYKITEILGAGGFGQTYIACDTQRPGSPRCVVKHLIFSSQNEAVLQQVRRLFRAEAETLEVLGRHDQIPQLLAYFEIDQEFYLVQEFIPGHSLSQEMGEGVRWSEPAVINFLEDVLQILEFVHGRGVIHRDIKPDNLIRRPDQKLVLIDFGAVKNIGNTIAEATGETAFSIPIYTSGYGASEQCLGRPRYSSDLYSLGMIAIQALTGMRPSQLPQDLHTCEVIWRDQATTTDALAEILERMTCFHFNQRYQSATEVLKALRQISPASTTLSLAVTRPQERPREAIVDAPMAAHSVLAIAPAPSATNLHPASKPVMRPLKRWLFTGSALLALLIGGGLVGRSLHRSQPSTTVFGSVSERISFGEKLLNRWQSNPVKQEGTEQLAKGNFDQAVERLTTARQQQPGDPETLIYLNNARIGLAPAHVVAVVAPLGDTFGSSQEILRGVAQAQTQINQAGGINGVPLKVAIAHEDSTPETARLLAQALTSDPRVLGVVGHSISDTSLAAAPIYQRQQLVMISPLSSAVQLTDQGNYIFRTIPSDRATARALGDHMLTVFKQQKVAVFYNSRSDYSQSLRTEFRNALFYNGVEPLLEVDLARPDFDAYDSLRQATAQGAKVLMLAPDFTTIDRAIQVVIVNRRRLKLLGGDSVSTSKILTVAGHEAVEMVVAVPTNLNSQDFRQQFQALWGQEAILGWRTALAYDAAIALIHAIQTSPTRTGVQRALSEQSFAVDGAEATIRFMPSGDREARADLATVKLVKTAQGDRYEFQPLSK